MKNAVNFWLSIAIGICAIVLYAIDPAARPSGAKQAVEAKAFTDVKMLGQPKWRPERAEQFQATNAEGATVNGIVVFPAHESPQVRVISVVPASQP